MVNEIAQSRFVIIRHLLLRRNAKYAGLFKLLRHFSYTLSTCAFSACVDPQDRDKARRWDIPWGNPNGQVEEAKLERTLEALPGTEDVKESDCFRIMR